MMKDSRYGVGGIRCRNDGLDCRVTGLDESSRADGDENLVSVNLGHTRILIDGCYRRG